MFQPLHQKTFCFLILSYKPKRVIWKYRPVLHSSNHHEGARPCSSVIDRVLDQTLTSTDALQEVPFNFSFSFARDMVDLTHYRERYFELRSPQKVTSKTVTRQPVLPSTISNTMLGAYWLTWHIHWDLYVFVVVVFCRPSWCQFFNTNIFKIFKIPLHKLKKNGCIEYVDQRVPIQTQASTLR